MRDDHREATVPLYTTTCDGNGNVVSVTHLENGDTVTTVTPLHGRRFLRFDVTEDPQFLGDPPTARPDGSCTHCGRIVHVLFEEPVTARWFHMLEAGGGYFSDEVSGDAR